MMVREGVDQDDRVRLLAGPAEIPVHHDAGARTVRLGLSAVATGDIKPLHNDVVGRAQENHPVSYAGGLIDHDIAGLAHRFEVNEAPIGGTGFVSYDKTGIPARHHSN